MRITVNDLHDLHLYGIWCLGAGHFSVLKQMELYKALHKTCTSVTPGNLQP